MKEEAMKLLRRVGLEEKAGSYPRELSGGLEVSELQLSVHCACTRKSYFSMNVTAALDPEMVREVLDVILDLAAQGRTMIMLPMKCSSPELSQTGSYFWKAEKYKKMKHQMSFSNTRRQIGRKNS